MKLDSNVALQRINKRDETPTETIDFLNSVAKNYDNLATICHDFYILNGEKTTENLVKDIAHFTT